MKDEDVLKVAKKHDVEVPTILLSYQGKQTVLCS